MAVLLNHTAVRALLLAAILACIAAVTAPTARGAASSTPAITTTSSLTTPLLADEWSWDGFVKFWRSQGSSMTGVLGTVMLVGAAAVILVLYKGKG